MNFEPDRGGVDLAAVVDKHAKHEFVDRDLDATMATMVAEPYILLLPVMGGGVGQAGVRRFYREELIGRLPPDTEVVPVSRTIGEDQVVVEGIFSFTHDREVFFLPGVAPTGRRVELPHVVIFRLEGDKIAHEHLYWDQASLLVQVGLLDPGSLPVTGSDQAKRLLDKSLPRT